MTAQPMPLVSDAELMMSVTLVIAPEHREQYLDELRDVLPSARREPACLSLEVGEMADRPGTFVLSERWRSGNEYVHHVLPLPYFQRYLERTEPLYAVPRTVIVLTPVAPAEPDRSR